MSKYTTGEIAKICGVTVRTVQYYDTRNILVPSELSEGGRRMYSEDDLSKLKIICFLRELDLSINTIGELLVEENPEKVIHLLLEQQTSQLREEIGRQQEKMNRLTEMQKELRNIERFTVESIGDIADRMKNRSKRRKIYAALLAVGIPLNILQILSIVLWIVKGWWWLFLVWLVLDIALTVPSVLYLYKHTMYICPECHTRFRPSFKEMLFANHTPSTRRLTCTECGHHGFCVETYGGDIDEKND